MSVSIPIHFMCACGKAGGINIDEDQKPNQPIAVGPCQPRCKFSIIVTVNSIDKANRKISYHVAIKANEPVDY